MVQPLDRTALFARLQKLALIFDNPAGSEPDPVIPIAVVPVPVMITIVSPVVIVVSIVMTMHVIRRMIVISILIMIGVN
jgi:hypothetical protein